MKRKAPKNTDGIPFHKARRSAFRAFRRGDLDEAIRWTLLMRYQLRMARTVSDLQDNRLRPKPKKRVTAPAASAAPARAASPRSTPAGNRN